MLGLFDFGQVHLVGNHATLLAQLGRIKAFHIPSAQGLELRNKLSLPTHTTEHRKTSFGSMTRAP